MDNDYQLYFGDLHNHNAAGYAKGSLVRSFEVAREHLDFFAFTGHSQWHDMPTMPQEKHMVWVHGFERHTASWPTVKKLTEAHHTPGEFVTFAGYEWHSSDFGDYCAIFPGSESEYFETETIAELGQKIAPFGGILIPHHVAYAKNWRGLDWERFPQELCPLCEAFSEHGATMYDRGLHPMIRHSNGGRATKGTVQHALSRGYRFGIIGGTDDHFGYPGAWGEGLAAVWAEDLTRESIWEALLARRTYAVTGDRIGLIFELNGEPMGRELDFDGGRDIYVQVDAMDEIAQIELLRNGRVVHREHVPTILPEDTFEGGRAKLRIQWGWGPWSSLEMARTCEWAGEVSVQGGKLVRATPIFQSGPYEENLRDRLTDVSADGLKFESFTSRRDAFGEDATKGVILEIEGNPETRVTVQATRPSIFGMERTLAKLMQSSDTTFTGPFTSESVLMHRLLVPYSYEKSFSWTDYQNGSQDDYYMVRVTQSNGQMAWSSPIWVNKRK